MVVDITPHWAQKQTALAVFRSQFYHPDYAEPAHTYISTPTFWLALEARARELGSCIGVEFAEGFTCRRPFGLDDLLLLR